MPTLGAPLDFAKLEGRNFRGHLLGTAPAAPVTGQLYFNTGDNTLYWYDGTAWVSARGGVAAVPDASPSVKGIVQLAGDLAGTAASPQIAAGAVTDAEVAAANKDGAAGTPGMRTLGTSAGKAMDGLTRLDTIAAPTGPVSLNAQKLTLVGAPTNGQDAANKTYVDGVAQGLDVKGSVRAASTPAGGNVTLSGNQTVDGIAVTAGDRVLVKNQTGPNGYQCGIYVVAAGAWTRATDLDTWSELPGAFCFVESGTVNADTGWVCTNDPGGTIDVTTPVFVQFSGVGEYSGGAGLTLSGGVFAVGAGAGLQANADDVQIANNGITNAMLADGAVNLASTDVTGILPTLKGGTGVTSTISNFAQVKTISSPVSGATHLITAAIHGLGAYAGMMIQVMDQTTGIVELPDIQQAANGDITISWGVAPTPNSKYVTIIR